MKKKELKAVIAKLEAKLKKYYIELIINQVTVIKWSDIIDSDPLGVRSYPVEIEYKGRRYIYTDQENDTLANFERYNAYISNDKIHTDSIC